MKDRGRKCVSVFPRSSNFWTVTQSRTREPVPPTATSLAAACAVSLERSGAAKGPSKLTRTSKSNLAAFFSLVLISYNAPASLRRILASTLKSLEGLKSQKASSKICTSSNTLGSRPSRRGWGPRNFLHRRLEESGKWPLPVKTQKLNHRKSVTRFSPHLRTGSGHWSHFYLEYKTIELFDKKVEKCMLASWLYGDQL